MVDTVPRFPYPEGIYPRIHGQPSNDPVLLVKACNDEDLTSIIYELYNLNRLIIDETVTRYIWDDGVFAWKYIIPVLHKLLRISYEQLGPGSVVLRAGAMLYIAALRRRFGVRFSTVVQIQKLRASMTALLQNVDHVGYSAAAPVLLWLLVLGSTISELEDDHDWFVIQTTHHIYTMGYRSWDEAIGGSVKKVLWIDDILVDELELLRQEVSITMLDSYKRQFL
jgi:hypothetical protein